MFIGQFLLCSIVDKWLEKYEHDRRQDVEQGSTSQNAKARKDLTRTLIGGRERGIFMYSCVS